MSAFETVATLLSVISSSLSGDNAVERLDIAVLSFGHVALPS